MTAGDLIRYRALEQRAEALEAGMKAAPVGSEQRHELAREALAVRSRMLQLWRGEA